MKKFINEYGFFMLVPGLVVLLIGLLGAFVPPY